MSAPADQITTRRIVEGDLAGFRAMNSVFCEGFGEPETYADRPPGAGYAAAWLANPANIAILAERDDEPIGALAGYVLHKFEQARSELFIYDLAVLERHRRLGAGTAMIEEARRLARRAGAWTVWVQADSVPEDEPARALYRKFARSELTAHHFDIAP